MTNMTIPELILALQLHLLKNPADKDLQINGIEEGKLTRSIRKVWITDEKCVEGKFTLDIN